MSILVIVLFLAGLVLLVLGAEGLVRGGSRLAAAFRVSPLVIGLTVVAFGTSMPEMVVSVMAAIKGNSNIAVGNVVGSNIFNILCIMGLAAVIRPLVVHANVIRREVPVMIGVSLLLPLMAANNRIGRAEGAVLFAGIIAYTVFNYYQSRKETAATVREFEEFLEEEAPKTVPVPLNLLFVVGGLILLVLGARLMVDSAVSMARSLGLSERVIALTLVAAGTSMPELATSVVAAFRRQTDIAVGNVVGSSIFNILCILGAASLIRPLNVEPAILRFDIPVMIAAFVFTLPVVFSAHKVSRLEGAAFLVAFAAYTGYLLTP